MCWSLCDKMSRCWCTVRKDYWFRPTSFNLGCLGEKLVSSSQRQITERCAAAEKNNVVVHTKLYTCMLLEHVQPESWRSAQCRFFFKNSSSRHYLLFPSWQKGGHRPTEESKRLLLCPVLWWQISSVLGPRAVTGGRHVLWFVSDHGSLITDLHCTLGACLSVLRAVRRGSSLLLLLHVLSAGPLSTLPSCINFITHYTVSWFFYSFCSQLNYWTLHSPRICLCLLIQRRSKTKKPISDLQVWKIKNRIN